MRDPRARDPWPRACARAAPRLGPPATIPPARRAENTAGTALGATLVHELSCFGGSGGPAPLDGRYSGALPGILAAFRARVDAELPGMYAWLSEPSLHVTIRGLI